MYKIRANRLNPVVVPAKNDSERIVHKQKLSFWTVNRHKGLVQVSNHDPEPIHTLNQAFQLLDREGLPQFLKSCAKSATAAVNPDNDLNPHI